MCVGEVGGWGLTSVSLTIRGGSNIAVEHAHSNITHMYVVYKQLASYNIIATLHKYSQCSTKHGLCSVGEGTSLLLHTLKKVAAISVRVEHTAVG